MKKRITDSTEKKGDSLKPLVLFLTGALIVFATIQLDKSNIALIMFLFGMVLMLFSVILRFYYRVKHEY